MQTLQVYATRQLPSRISPKLEAKQYDLTPRHVAIKPHANAARVQGSQLLNYLLKFPELGNNGVGFLADPSCVHWEDNCHSTRAAFRRPSLFVGKKC